MTAGAPGPVNVGRPVTRVPDPWSEVPMALRRYWSLVPLAAALGAGWLWLHIVGLVVVALGIVLLGVVLPRPVNLPRRALRALHRPDGAPRLRVRRFRRALEGCPGTSLPSRIFFTSYRRDRTRGLERYEWRPWPGDYVGRWSGPRTEALRTAFGALHAQVTETPARRLRLRLLYPAASQLGPAPHLARAETEVVTQPIPLGQTATGESIGVLLDQANILVSGVPGAGKSGLLHLVCGWTALDPWCHLVLIDGKGLSELGRWQGVAAGCATSLADACALLAQVEAERQRRQRERAARGLRIWRPGEVATVVVVIDELAVFTDLTGTSGEDRTERQHFIRLLVDLVRLGRADRIVVVAATQRPSADVVPTAFRDLVGVRVALRCTTREQAQIALGAAWAEADPTTLPTDPGAFVVVGAGSDAQRGQAYWLTEDQIEQVLRAARAVRQPSAPPPPPPAALAPPAVGPTP
jgi:S-DNA-T family DNA segregation ATPase FtsK/SpoIIIE